MSAEFTPPPAGRVLVIEGQEGPGLASRLVAQGYRCASVCSPAALQPVVEELRPEVVVFTHGAQGVPHLFDAIRADPILRELPLVGDLTGGSAEGLRELALDDWIRSPEELTPRLEAVLRARRLVERDARSRTRMEVLLEITQAAASALEPEQVFRLAVERAGRVLSSPRCSVVLVDGADALTARVVASRESPRLTSLQIDLARYPELRKALETRQAVYIGDATTDPLMDEVREQIAPLGIKSILVQPLICQDDLLGALYLRLAQSDRSFVREEQEFAAAVATALANSLRNARLHTALKRKRDELESAYVDRYRELTEANRRLKEINRVKDEIIAVVSHDLRAPLQVLLGHGRLLIDARLGPEQQMSAEAIVRQGKKILGMVESLLERGRGELARVSIEPALLDAAELCKEASGDLAILASERRVTLRAETPESLPVLGDEVKLREVLQNLITNAIHHAREDGHVIVWAQRLRRPDGDAVRITVRDDGAGIPHEQLHLVFDRWRHGPGGTGLGLAICKEFVELHGGEIWAENPPGGGCAFVVTLPLTGGNLSSKEKSRPDPLELPRVLVVEDEPEVAAVLAEILRSRYRVEVARDGAEGLAKAKGLHPDLVVMDVFLPRLDGLDAAVALKSSSDTADIPVILLSAHQGVAEKVRALNLGAVDYLHKPFQALELLARTERALKLHTAERELERSLVLLRRSGSDPQTGLFDRLGLVARLEQEISRGRRYGRALALAALIPSRPLGDKARSCASIVRGKLRSPDVVGHLGSGAFVVILPECNAEGARAMLGRLLPDMEKAAGSSFDVKIVDIMESDTASEALLDRLLADRERSRGA